MSNKEYSRRKHMFKILKAEQLSANVYMKVVEAPRVAKTCAAG